jgi:hypothetical protein
VSGVGREGSLRGSGACEQVTYEDEDAPSDAPGIKQRRVIFEDTPNSDQFLALSSRLGPDFKFAQPTRLSQLGATGMSGDQSKGLDTGESAMSLDVHPDPVTGLMEQELETRGQSLSHSVDLESSREKVEIHPSTIEKRKGKKWRGFKWMGNK